MNGVQLISARCPHCAGTGSIKASSMGLRLKVLRMQAGMTQAGLSARTNGAISPRHVGNIETGYNPDPPLAALRAIAKVLGVSVGFLIDGHDPYDPLG